MKNILALFLISFLFLNTSLAAQSHPYYGEQFYQNFPELSDEFKEVIQPQFNFKSLTEKEIKDLLFDILSSSHRKINNSFDEISKQCQGKGCYRHQNFSYKQARKYMMGDLYLEGSSNRSYSIESYYCLTTFTNDDFGKKPLGPNKIPNHTVMNTEHLWPQSKFNARQSKSLQKSDLHALRPVRTKVNSARGNLPFGEIDYLTKSHCPSSGSGSGKIDGLSGDYFEPPDMNKGNIARALFYFAIRYKLNIPDAQEKFLRQWHIMDPIDQEEIDLHESVFSFQKNRNPFIDHPELLNKLSDI